MDKQKRKLLIIGGIVALSLVVGIVALTGKQTQQFKGMFFAPRMGEESTPERPSPDMTEGVGILAPEIQPLKEEKKVEGMIDFTKTKTKPPAPPPPAPSPAPAPLPAAPVAPSLTVQTADSTNSISRTAGDTSQFTAAKILFKATGKVTVKIITISEYVDEAAGQNVASNIETIALFVSRGNGETLFGKETALAEDGTATFENFNWTLINSEEKLIIKIRLKKNAAAGTKLTVGIDTPIDIISEGANDLKGSFPLIGNEIVLKQSTTVAQASPTSPQTVPASTTAPAPAPAPAPSSKTSATITKSVATPEPSGAKTTAAGTTTTSKTQAAPTFSASTATPTSASTATPSPSSQTVAQRNAARSASSSSSTSVSPSSSPVIRVIENQHAGAYAPTDTAGMKTESATPAETGTAATDQNKSASSPSVRVSDTVLSQMPEQAKTGPGLFIYLSALGIVHGGLFLKRKFKNK